MGLKKDNVFGLGKIHEKGLCVGGSIKGRNSLK
jgi:hypothetical protein